MLGTHWDIATDQLVMSLEEVATAAAKLKLTKRSIVSLMGRFFDYLALLSLVIVQFKVFLQDLCAVRLEWDETLTGTLLVR